jgi:dihydrodipicolinate synthase/N-acetylneuraminate lyase
MIGPPNTLRTDDQVINYYRQAADAIGPDVPIVVQDYPLSFSVQMSPSVIRTMVQETPSIVMLKHEDWPGLAVRKYTLMKRGILASDAQRKPGSAISALAKTEVDYLLARVAKTDKRAAI